eukprot:8416616-Pyramimonas_sp.AAC.1
MGAGRRLQPISTLDDRDHRPAYADVFYTFEAHAQPKHTWDYDAIMLRLRGQHTTAADLETIHQAVLDIDEPTW